MGLPAANAGQVPTGPLTCTAPAARRRCRCREARGRWAAPCAYAEAAGSARSSRAADAQRAGSEGASAHEKENPQCVCEC